MDLSWMKFKSRFSIIIEKKKERDKHDLMQ